MVRCPTSGDWKEGVVSNVGIDELKVVYFHYTHFSRAMQLRLPTCSPDIELKRADGAGSNSRSSSPASTLSACKPTRPNAEDPGSRGVLLKYIQAFHLSTAFGKGDAQIEVIDVRDRGFEEDHIFGARHIPQRSFDDAVPKLADEFAYSGKTVVFCMDEDYCDNEDDEEVDDAYDPGVEFIRYLICHCPGATCEVNILQGGFTAWRQHVSRDSTFFIARHP